MLDILKISKERGVVNKVGGVPGKMQFLVAVNQAMVPVQTFQLHAGRR
jgi:hypothetical protein